VIIKEEKVIMGERGYVTSPGLSIRTPKSRDEMGEGGDDFYIARSGRYADLP
jgi:hypothetical protein